MAPTLQQVMEALAAAVDNVSGLRVAAYGADQINPPQAVIGVPPIDNYHMTMRRGRMQLPLAIYVLVSANLDRVGQMNLAAYANPTGSSSIVAAIYADKTLGGVVEDVKVESFRPLSIEEVGALGFYGGVFDVQVIADGN